MGGIRGRVLGKFLDGIEQPGCKCRFGNWATGGARRGEGRALDTNEDGIDRVCIHRFEWVGDDEVHAFAFAFGLS